MNTTLCFPLDPQAQVAAALAEAVHERMSAALIAPAGTGKTVALRMLVAALPETRFQVHYVKVTGLSKRDLCKEIAVACGLSPTGIYPALVRKLQDAFAPSDGMRPVILLDEAHDLRPESLAMLRVLTNFEMDSRLVVSPRARRPATPETAPPAPRNKPPSRTAWRITPSCACCLVMRPAPGNMIPVV